MKLSIILLLLVSQHSIASIKKANHIKYITQIGQCPAKVAGHLSLKLVREFESHYSLKKLKKYIVDNRIEEKFFLSDYNIDYQPLQRLLKFKYQCPAPLMAVHLLKDNEKDFYKAILVDNGQLYDPNYEVVLRYEKKLTRELPSLVLPVKNMGDHLQKKLTKLVGSMPNDVYQHLAEMIYDEQNELTLILSIKNQPSSVYLGNQLWEEKLIKLSSVVSFMEEKNKIPNHINMMNMEKIVVKFSL